MSVPKIIDAVLAELARATSVTHEKHIGAKNIAGNSRPPRLVWIPKADRFGPPAKTAQNPRALRTRHATLELHVWGADYEATEILLHQVIAAVHAVAVGSYELGDSEWDVDENVVQRGALVIVDITFSIPVTEAPQPTVKITSVSQTLAAAMASGEITNP